MDHVAEVPGTIVQGRYDMICPPISAQRLHDVWPKSRLVIVPRAGHALSEPGISAELVRTMDHLRRMARV
jgi:proline iminopeptidase